VPYPSGAHPEAFSLQPPPGALLFGSAPLVEGGGADLSLLVVVDRRNNSVVASWPLATLGLQQPFANLLDDESGHLFVATRGDGAGALPAFAVLDTRRAGALVFSTPTNYVCDDVEFAPRLGLIFVSCGGEAAGQPAGSSLTVVRQNRHGGGAVSYELLGDVATMPPHLQLARTSFWLDEREELVLAGDDENAAKGAQCVVGHEQRASQTHGRRQRRGCGC
jgi:hypothetical protein